MLAERLGIEPGLGCSGCRRRFWPGPPWPASPRPWRRGDGAGATSFVGREQALAEATESVGRHRLVTLIGPPGVGKSRLALGVARAVSTTGGGVWFVELARACGPLTWRVVARTLDARGLTPSRDPLAGWSNACARQTSCWSWMVVNRWSRRRPGWPRACWPNVLGCGAGDQPEVLHLGVRSGWWWRRCGPGGRGRRPG